MSSGKIHRVVGGVAGGVAAGVRAHRDPNGRLLIEALAGMLGGSHGGMLPDVLEPAIHSHHRQVMHSWTLLGGTALGVVRNAAALEAYIQSWTAKIGELEELAPQAAPFEAFLIRLGAVGLHAAIGYVTGLAAGYASHLALDALTPRGLPLLGRVA